MAELRQWTKKHNSKLQLISYIISNLDLNATEFIFEFLISQFKKEKLIKVNNTDDLRSYVDCLIYFKNNLSINPFYILNSVINKIEYLSELYTFIRLYELFPKNYYKFIKKPFFENQVLNMIKIEIDNLEIENVSELISDIEHWESEFKLDLSDPLTELRDIELSNPDNYSHPQNDRFKFDSSSSFGANNYEKEINEMFSTLRHHNRNGG